MVMDYGYGYAYYGYGYYAIMWLVYYREIFYCGVMHIMGKYIVLW